MKKIDLYIIAALLTAIVALEMGGYWTYGKYTPFYHQLSQDDQFEVNHSLYSVADPILGYSHNESFVPSKRDLEKHFFNDFKSVDRSNNGFVVWKYKEELSPTRIAIIGSSAADPYMFEGNWPKFLHEYLIKKNIPHIIYNGAVSGYQSYQQLFKLIRDVFSLGPINYVIAYNGPSDLEESYDSLKEYPAIHQYQKFLFDSMLGNATYDKDPSVLPNLQYLFKKIKFSILHPNTFLQLGVANNSRLQSFYKNTEYMNAVSTINGAKFFHFLQPIVHRSKLNDEAIKKIHSEYSKETMDLAEKRMNELNNLFQKLNYSHSMDTFLPQDEKLFSDESHLSNEGNRLVAEEIARIMGL